MARPTLSTPQRIAGSRIAAVAASQPRRRLTADQLGKPFGRDGAWVTRRTGIQELRRGATAAELVEHACAAGRTALADGNVEPAEVDLLIVASCSLIGRQPVSDEIAPAIAPCAARMDLNAACSGFSYALDVADGAIRIGSARRVLVVAVEWMSTLIDADDLGTAIIFGDGAGAMLLTAAEDGEVDVWPAVYGSAGELSTLISSDDASSGPRLRMEGREVFRWAVETVPAHVVAACARAGLTTSDIDVLVLHQANLRIIEAIVRQLDLRPDVVVATDVTHSGNTSAASVPIALSKLRATTAHLPARATAVLAGFGAGLSFSAQVVRLP